MGWVAMSPKCVCLWFSDGTVVTCYDCVKKGKKVKK